MKKFESRIIDPILKLIKIHQGYLTQKENLPQLAKLGYMYNTLWYAGRHASYSKVIEKNQCDDNPKYKIDICEPEDEDIENYIYDAWGMHILNGYGPNWNEFSTIVLKGKPLTELEIKLLKPNKTFDEWVEVLTDENFRYSSIYPDRKSVANHMLCVIGNGYGYKNGFIIDEASGANQDITDYGDWMNCTFREDIQKIVDVIMIDPDVEKVIHLTEESQKKHDEEELAKEIKSWGMPYAEFIKSDKYQELIKMFPDKSDAGYTTYYSICSYSKITMLDKDSDPSYINAAVEICEDILLHRDEESKEQKGNVAFAERFLKKHKNNFIDTPEDKVTLSAEQLKLKTQQVKSSFSVEGLPLIKSDRFTQEEYDGMKAKTDAHKCHSEHLKVGKKVWSDKEIGVQITTMMTQNKISEQMLHKFVELLYDTLTYENEKKDLAVFKSGLYKKLGWDKLVPFNRDFWANFGAAPCSMGEHRNIGDVEKGYGAVGMDDIFDNAFDMTYYLTYEVNNILYMFKDNWGHRKHK